MNHNLIRILQRMEKVKAETEKNKQIINISQRKTSRN